MGHFTAILLTLFIAISSCSAQVGISDCESRTIYHELPEFLIPNNDNHRVHVEQMCYNRTGKMLFVRLGDSLNLVSHCIEVRRDDYDDSLWKFHNEPDGNDTITVYKRLNNFSWLKTDYQLGIEEEIFMTTTHVYRDTMYFEHDIPPFDMHVSYRDYYKMEKKN
jgi:hypothetical protein